MILKQKIACKNQKTTMKRKSTMKKQQIMISRMLNLQIW
jgi:hypothetical protein